MKKVTRNEYFALCRSLVHAGKLPDIDKEYEIAPIDFSGYALNDTTKRIVDVNFMEETIDKHGEYMLSGHWFSQLSYQFADKCDFELKVIDGYSSYAFSDEQMALFTYCEGDITFSPYKDRKAYEKRKGELIEFYEKHY